MPSLNKLSFPEIQAAIALSAGRPLHTANRVEIKDFGDCCRCDFWWDDEACYSMLHDTASEALEQARSNGFNV